MDLQKLIRVISYIDHVYKREATEFNESSNYRTFQTYANYSERVLKVVGISYVILSITYLLYPIFLLIVYGEVYLPLRVYFPFIDETDDVDAIILLVFSLLLTLFLALILCPFDIFLVNVFMSMRMLSSIVTRHVHEFELILVNRISDDALAAKFKLFRIILEHQKYNA